jgi:cytochrome oxidase Cu insertion factor (SCO1/SenC/PrrC family)
VLLGSDGRPAAQLDLRPGEAALVSFVYLSCGEECPLSTATLHSLDRELAADAALAARVKLVTVSFDPARDTPERMAALAKGLAPKGRWQFLTSEGSAALAPVLADFGQDSVWLPSAEQAQAPGRLRHVLKVFLVDARRDVRNVYSTGLLDERIVLNDLRTVLGATAGPSGAHPSSHH